MIFIVVATALASAFLDALSGVIQRRVAGNPSAEKLFRGNFMVNLAKNKVWLTGVGLQVAAFLLQAAALRGGSLIVVEPLLTTDLVFLMLMLHFKFGVATGRREWGAVAAICVGLSGLLVIANPRGGHAKEDVLGWAIISSMVAAVLAVSIYYVRRSKSSMFRAGLAGTAAGFNFALTAGFTKLVVSQLDQGLVHVFTTWPLYALLVTGLMSIVMVQSTYGAGPLAVSQPAMEITSPVISAMIGIILFKDIINLGAGDLFGEVICAALAAAGIVLMAGSRRIYESKL